MPLSYVNIMYRPGQKKFLLVPTIKFQITQQARVCTRIFVWVNFSFTELLSVSVFGVCGLFGHSGVSLYKPRGHITTTLSSS